MSIICNLSILPKILAFYLVITYNLMVIELFNVTNIISQVCFGGGVVMRKYSTESDKSRRNGDSTFIRTQSVMFNNIATYEQQCDVSATDPLLHQTARFIYVREGLGTIKIKQNLYHIKKNSLLVLMPWQVSEITEVTTPLFYDLITFNFTFLDYLLKHNLNTGRSNDQLRDTLYSVSCLNLDAASGKYVNYLFNDIADLLEYKPLNRTGLHLESSLNRSSSNDTAPVGTTSLANLPLNHLKVLQKVTNDSLAFFADNATSTPEISAAAKNDVWSTVRLTAKMIDLIALYMQLAAKQAAYKDIPAADLVPANYNNRSIFQYIYNNLIYHPSIDAVAAEFMMSSSTLDRYIRKTTGETFASLTKTMKVIKTIDYIIYTEFTLAEIAHLMGYTDASYISKLVFEKTGKHTQDIRNDSAILTLIKHDKNWQLAKKIAAYMYEHFAREVSAGMVATLFKISPNQLNSILMEAYERNFYEMLMFIRLTKAGILLTTTDLDITDIAYRVGFNSTKTFVRNFSKVYQQTPGKFRNKTVLQAGDFPSDLC
ncbi:AraC family transcriptional regulator [Amygdalobacter indicium]|uniref:AraC family transcriptional regulator n=1 Tax=Amygdalobacter indicium TaxID=3029272 RepID=A0ABY8C338_9FIRM|nr:AraC family transcriptional regulator [Amygdalobacter indicium]WEG35098.1 AraC family transcriptional regulator [Amygdalobacter indicium]